MTLMLLGLAAATLVSEDLTSVFTGALIADGRVSAWAGVMACVVGIYAGDLLLFAGGRALGPWVLSHKWLVGTVPAARVARLRAACGRHLGLLVLGSRWLPGTRLPLYVAAGALGCKVGTFALWSAIAVLVWTPLVILATAQLVPSLPSRSWSTQLAMAALLIALLGRMPRWLTRPFGSERRAAAIARLWRWEFWPPWIFYAPVAVWLLLLSLRYRGPGVVAAANPGMPDGGIIGESKADILQRLPREWTIPFLTVECDDPTTRVAALRDALCAHGWQFPLVFKPDVGQRGAGVALIRSAPEASTYLAQHDSRVLVQPFHPGPYEAGVFYYRHPAETRGRILSITDKHFPVVIGDGRSSLEQLVWSDSRLRMQAGTFLSRFASTRRRIPTRGERVTLSLTGNHCQGALFRDGAHLITPALEDRIEGIARHYPGFFIGRFDIRYANVDAFKAGRDLAIVELNGATAESTNIYDPDSSLVSAYRQLFVQWGLVFAIGAANRARGTPVPSLRRMLVMLGEGLAVISGFPYAASARTNCPADDGPK